MLQASRKIVILRHGERLDFSFGDSWIKENYVQEDLNMPESLPPRKIDNWKHDTPLSVLGHVQAELVGASLKKSGIKFSNVFVSPSYRCVQTAASVIKGMGLEKEMKINVEWGQFEWVGYYKGVFPNFLSDQEFSEHFNVDETYQPVITREELLNDKSQTFVEFYGMNSKTTREILKRFEGNILIVAHGSNIETCTRQLLGREPRPWTEFTNMLIDVPYLAAVALEKTGDSFKLIDPPCLSLTHDSSAKFDWTDLEREHKEKLTNKSASDARKKGLASYINNVE